MIKAILPLIVVLTACSDDGEKGSDGTDDTSQPDSAGDATTATDATATDASATDASADSLDASADSSPADADTGTEVDVGACIAEGQSGAVVPNAPACCEGLTSVSCDTPGDGGQCAPCAGGFVCTKCGDGTCGLGENTCNCADDCAEQCVAEGDTVPVVPNAPSCCDGLAPIGCDTPDGSGACSEPCVGAARCAKCGDDICGTGENKCNCPDDCAEACVAEGDSVPVIPNAPACCAGLAPIACDAPDGAGACSEPCVGAARCAKCGDDICGTGENKCNCPGDCD